MQNYVIYSPDSYKSMRWRNGSGHTVEVLKQSLPESEDFAWRLSMADVAADGEFSNFNGYDRTLLLLGGAGMTLECASGQRFDLRKPLQVARFNGDDSTFATLHDGPINDFNIMCSREHCCADVISHDKPDGRVIEVTGDILAVYVVGESLTIRSELTGELSVARGHLFCARRPGKQSLECCGGEFIAVQINELDRNST